MTEETVPHRPRSIFLVTLIILCVLYTSVILQRHDRIKRIDPATATPAEMLELNLSQVNQAIGNYIFALVLATVISVPTDAIRRWLYDGRLKRSQVALAAEQTLVSPSINSPSEPSKVDSV